MAKPKTSAGILFYRVMVGQIEVLLAHPGGPVWANKDEGVWTIPKGEPDGDEDLQLTAVREFLEETGHSPSAPLVELGTIVQKSGKRVYAWASEGDLDPASVHSNSFEMEWPPRSGKWAPFPEVDRCEWMSLAKAAQKINPAQILFLERLAEFLK